MVQKTILKNSFDYFISILYDLNQLNLNKKIIKKKSQKIKYKIVENIKK